MLEVWFLGILAIFLVSVAVITDLRKKEVPNWVVFSLIIFSLGFRLFYSLFDEATNFMFLVNGLIGLALFFVAGSLLYHGRMFAGGDAKLFFALGPILPLSSSITSNLKLFGVFFVLFLFAGALWGIVSIIYYMTSNFVSFRKKFIENLKNNRKVLTFSVALAILFLGLGFIEEIFFYMSLFVFALPYLYFSATSVDSVCMVRKVAPEKLVIGDWVAKDIRAGSKDIVREWRGLGEKDIEHLKKRGKKVWVQYGVPFTPAFLISLLAFFGFWIGYGGLEVVKSLFI